jgi:hypothetical protein
LSEQQVPVTHCPLAATDALATADRFAGSPSAAAADLAARLDDVDAGLVAIGVWPRPLPLQLLALDSASTAVSAGARLLWADVAAAWSLPLSLPDLAKASAPAPSTAALLPNPRPLRDFCTC